MKSLQSNSKGSNSKGNDASRDDLADPRWREIRARLMEQKSRIFAEMRGYPPPITACDAQFNHLIEQSNAIRQELRRLEDWIGEGVIEGKAGKFPDEFIRSSAFLGRGEEGVPGERTE